MLAEGDGLGGGFDCLASVVMGLLSVDHGIDGFDAIAGSKGLILVRLVRRKKTVARELDVVEAVLLA